MKAALIDRYGSNDAVSVADIDIPTLGATDCWFSTRRKRESGGHQDA